MPERAVRDFPRKQYRAPDRCEFSLDSKVVLLRVCCLLRRVLRSPSDRGQIDPRDIDKSRWNAVLQPEQSISSFEGVASGNLRIPQNDERRVEP